MLHIVLKLLCGFNQQGNNKMKFQEALEYYGVPEAQTIDDLKSAYENKNHRMPNGSIADNFEQWLISEANDSIHCEQYDL